MKASLEFALPEESKEHALAVNGGRWAGANHTLAAQLRSWLKHGHEFTDADAALQAVHAKLYEILEDNRLSFDDLQ